MRTHIFKFRGFCLLRLRPFVLTVRTSISPNIIFKDSLCKIQGPAPGAFDVRMVVFTGRVSAANASHRFWVFDRRSIANWAAICRSPVVAVHLTNPGLNRVMSRMRQELKKIGI